MYTEKKTTHTQKLKAKKSRTSMFDNATPENTS